MKKVALLEGPRKKKIEKKQLSLGKKVCNFKWYLDSSQTYTESFGGENLAPCRIFPSKVKACA